MTIHILDAAACTEKGLVRKHNEDAFKLLSEYGVVVLADGMGGHKAGEIASEMAVQKISASLVVGVQHSINGFNTIQDLLQQAVISANQAIFEVSEQSIECKGMGTTVVAGVFYQGKLSYAHVGDSRLYLLRDGRLSLLTRDHTMLQFLLDRGVFQSQCDAKAAGISSSQLTRAIGFDAEVDVDCAEMELKPGDVFLFCSDGLTNMVTDGMISAVIQENVTDLSSAADLLLELALDQGGTDNITLVLARPEESVLD